MISAAALDALLTLVAALWIVLSLAIVLDRYRYDRRRRLASALHTRLRLAPSVAGDSATAITADEFQDMVLAGLPPDVESAIAERISARNGDHMLRQLAAGARRADVRTRILALQTIVSSRHRDTHYLLDRCLRCRSRDVAASALRMLVRVDDRRAAEILVAALRERVFNSSRVAAALELGEPHRPAGPAARRA